jgi:hypothetical protein
MPILPGPKAGAVPGAELATRHSPPLAMESKRFSDPGSPEGSSTTIFVWALWGALFFSAVGFVWTYGCNIPFCDEWIYVPNLVGEKPINFEYFWGQHNEHRIPVPKLITLVLIKLTDFDLRAGMYLNAIGLGILALVLLCTIKKIRGHFQFSDTIFPIALVHFGHCENIIWSFQIQFVLSTVLAGILLSMIVLSGFPLTLRKTLLSGFSLILLPLCGANGLFFVPLLAPWFIIWGFRNWDASCFIAKKNSFLLILMGLVSIVLVGLYLWDYHRPPGHNLNPKAILALTTAWECLSIGAGPGIISFWPFAGYLVLALFFFSTLALIILFRNRPQERFRTTGLFLFALSVGLLVGVIGWGRAGYWEHAGFAPRYAALSVLGFFCSFFIWEFLGYPTLSSLFKMSLFTFVCTLFSLNGNVGIESAKNGNQSLKAFEEDLSTNLSAIQLAKKHSFLFSYDANLLASGIETMRRANLGIFRTMVPPSQAQMVDPEHVPNSLSKIHFENTDTSK